MSWLNVFGLGFLVIILIPNLIFALKCPQGFENPWQNRRVEIIEQIGRFGCMAFMAVNIPGTWFGWWSDEAFAVYLIADTLLAVAYCLVWLFCFRKTPCSGHWRSPFSPRHCSCSAAFSAARCC